MFPRAVPAAAPPRPYTVSELLSEVGMALRTSWREIAVAGEIGGWDVRNGHAYFTLKDRTASINAVIFASDLRRIPFKISPGLEVVARGALDLWAPKGRFQLKAWTIEPVGAGALQLAFEQLKARLAAEGLFDPGRKRRIPALPRRIAIVTSPDGAAIRDILNVLKRRHDTLAVTIWPARVQGDMAAAEVAQGIRAVNRRGGFDVLIVARGGGSAEDLAPFNDERVARALASSRIPTISAVGHETDVTIADLIADLRAPTPSAAAELVVERKEELCRRVSDIRSRAGRAIGSRLHFEQERLRGLSRAEGLLKFRYRVKDLGERVGQGRDTLVAALARRPAAGAARLASTRRVLESFARVVELPRRLERVAALSSSIAQRMERGLERRRGRLREGAQRLEALSPLAVLARGYAVAYREGSRAPLLAASSVAIGEKIRVRLHEGELNAVVRERGLSSGTRRAKEEPPPRFGPLFDEEKR